MTPNQRDVPPNASHLLKHTTTKIFIGNSRAGMRLPMRFGIAHQHFGGTTPTTENDRTKHPTVDISSDQHEEPEVRAARITAKATVAAAVLGVVIAILAALATLVGAVATIAEAWLATR
ncbi:hypothetical protein ACTMTJ_36525 [Phytohabitans sp. LJ34]|uniref:hypothetical protein n=1 Tax=Phytohabitans sp. LJ34 TaxID=3452217 RepID=UPI003F8AA360